MSHTTVWLQISCCITATLVWFLCMQTFAPCERTHIHPYIHYVCMYMQTFLMYANICIYSFWCLPIHFCMFSKHFLCLLIIYFPFKHDCIHDITRLTITIILSFYWKILLQNIASILKKQNKFHKPIKYLWQPFGIFFNNISILQFCQTIPKPNIYVALTTFLHSI